MNNLPAELKQRIYEYDDTYKPSFDNKIWFAIHMELIEKAKSYWCKRYPLITCSQFLYNWERDNRDYINGVLDRMCKAIDDEEDDYDDSDNDEEDDFDYTDSCDCCVKGWSKANEFGRCECVCECLKLYRDCQYKCKSESEYDESESNCNCDIEEVEEGFIYCPKKSCGKFICLEDCDTGDNYHFICCECNFKFKY